MNAKRTIVVFIVLVISMIMSGCNGISPSDARATSMAAVSGYATLMAKEPTLTPQIVEVTKVVEVIQTVEVLVTPAATVTPTEIPVKWMQIQVAKYVPVEKPVIIDDVLWELPLGTWFAVTKANGFYEAVPSAKAGVIGDVDYEWCKPNQFDCPPHALLVRVEVPEDKISCLKAEMDISWRINITNTCGQPAPVRFNIRRNDITRTVPEQQLDYLALAGLKQQPLDTLSEVGLFVSVKEAGMSSLSYDGKESQYGYSCWNCLPDTIGPNDPIPYPLTDIDTFGLKGSGPTGSTLLPGVVFPLPRPDSQAYLLSFELKVVDASVVWAGRYDVKNAPTPTATPTTQQ